MKIALCFRGIHYAPFYRDVDYRKNFQNNIEFLINPLKENNDVDTFLCTYESDIQNNLLNDLNPVVSIFNNLNTFNEGNHSSHKILTFNKQLIESIKDYEHKNNILYDAVIILRFDLIFKVKINEWNIDYEKINAVFEHVHNCDNYRHVEDNIFIISRKYLEHYYDAILITLNKNEITHRICMYVDRDKLHYIYTITQQDLDNKNEYKLYTIGR